MSRNGACRLGRLGRFVLPSMRVGMAVWTPNPRQRPPDASLGRPAEAPGPCGSAARGGGPVRVRKGPAPYRIPASHRGPDGVRMKDDSGRLALLWGPLLLVAVLVAVFRLAETGSGDPVPPPSRGATADGAPAAHPPGAAATASGPAGEVRGLHGAYGPFPAYPRAAYPPQYPKPPGYPPWAGVPVGAAVPPAGRPFGTLLGERGGGVGPPRSGSTARTRGSTPTGGWRRRRLRERLAGRPASRALPARSPGGGRPRSSLGPARPDPVLFDPRHVRCGVFAPAHRSQARLGNACVSPATD